MHYTNSILMHTIVHNRILLRTTHIHTHTYMYVYTHTYIHVHTHTHISLKPFQCEWILTRSNTILQHSVHIVLYTYPFLKTCGGVLSMLLYMCAQPHKVLYLCKQKVDCKAITGSQYANTYYSDGQHQIDYRRNSGQR